MGFRPPFPSIPGVQWAPVSKGRSFQGSQFRDAYVPEAQRKRILGRASSAAVSFFYLPRLKASLCLELHQAERKLSRYGPGVSCCPVRGNAWRPQAPFFQVGTSILTPPLALGTPATLPTLLQISAFLRLKRADSPESTETQI